MASGDQGLLRRVGFFGDAHTPDDHPDYVDAYQTARYLALNNYSIVNGGGPGIMDAATQGCESAGGVTVAVTMDHKETTGFEGRYLRNLDKVDREIVEPNYMRRMTGLIEQSDVFVIFRGGSGTMSELGSVWVLANIYYGHHKPFILFGDFWHEILEVLQRNMNIDAKELSVLRVVTSKEETLEAIEQFEWELEQADHSHCEVCDERGLIT